MRPLISRLAMTGAAVLALGGFAAVPSHAAIVSGFDANTLAADDDGSTGQITLPFTLDFFGVDYSSLYVNNNGNMTFTGPQTTYTPYNLYTNGTPIIAPFFADVDTRGAGSGLTSYGTGTYDGFQAFGVTWPAVGYYDSKTDKLDTFQALLVDRADTGAGNFDIVYNYGSMQWETGDVSGGTDGLGGSSARVGYSNGTQADSYELPGSGTPGSFIDGGPDALNGLTYTFQVRNGNVAPPVVSTAVPEASSFALLGLGLLPVVVIARRRRAQA